MEDVIGDDVWEQGQVSVKEACALLDCSRSRLYALMKSGALPNRYEGRNRKLARAGLVAHMATTGQGGDDG